MGKKIYITESQLDYIIKNVDLLNEQTNTQPIDSPEGEVKENFDASFLDNMISFNPDESREAYNKFFTAIGRKQKGGEIIKKITLNISSTATKARATNKLPDGVTKPDHTYGGKVPANLWTTVDKRLSESEVDKLPEGYTPQQGYYPIKGGNEFLAMNRGLQLQKYLKNVLIQTYKIPEDKIISPDPVWSVDQPDKIIAARMLIDSIPFEEVWGLCFKDVKISVNMTKVGSIAGGGYWWKGRGGSPTSEPQGAIDLIEYLQQKGSSVNTKFGIGSRVNDSVNKEEAGRKLHELVMNYAKSGVKSNGRILGLGYNNDLLEEFLVKSVGEGNLNPTCSKIERNRRNK